MKHYNEQLKWQRDTLFKQYQLYVEMADNVSKRRETSNKFYLTIDSVFFPSFIYLMNTTNGFGYSNIFFIILSLICTWWFVQINEYKKLNEGKFKVIIEIEKYLPLAGFEMEWKEIKPDYVELTNIEKYIPLFLKFFYFILLILNSFNDFYDNLIECIIVILILIGIDFYVFYKIHGKKGKTNEILKNKNK